jgi:riboflavin biosynthesis pyrimidine reductase
VYRHTGFRSPLRSYGSLSMNRALMVAGLVDRVQLTVFPVITGQTGVDPSSLVRPTSSLS